MGSTEEFQRPFFLLLNLAVAGNWPGQTVDESKLPATMYVDYVRVYQLTSRPRRPSVTLQAESANVNNGMVVEACSEGRPGHGLHRRRRLPGVEQHQLPHLAAPTTSSTAWPAAPAAAPFRRT